MNTHCDFNFRKLPPRGIVHRSSCIVHLAAWGFQDPNSRLRVARLRSGLRSQNTGSIYIARVPGLALMPHAGLPGSHRCWYRCCWQGRGILAFCQSFSFAVSLRGVRVFLSFPALPSFPSFVPFALLTSVLSTFLPISLPSCLWWQHSIARVDATGHDSAMACVRVRTVHSTRNTVHGLPQTANHARSRYTAHAHGMHTAHGTRAWERRTKERKRERKY